MPKEKSQKKSTSALRHDPLGKEVKEGKDARGTQGRNFHKKVVKGMKPDAEEGDDDMVDDSEEVLDSNSLPAKLGTKIYQQAREQLREEAREEQQNLKSHSKTLHNTTRNNAKVNAASADDDWEDDDEDNTRAVGAESDEDDAEMSDNEIEEDDEIDVEFDGDEVRGVGLDESEEEIVQRFLLSGAQASRTLADIIMEKIKEKTEKVTIAEETQSVSKRAALPPKVVEVYTAVGKLLKHYKSGKLPRALKMMPHLKNWEDVLWLTRPDQWSACATYACTRIFASNLNAKMAQRFYNVVLLEKCLDDIRTNKVLNYHLYMALKKALFKPAAFYKGILLPLCQSQTCSLREATIIGSVLAKVSIPGNHSAAALLRLAEMPYSGSNSVFMRVLINKKYALPKRCIDAVVTHFMGFEEETRELPVIWHQALLAFAQRYKLAIDDDQREQLKSLLRAKQHVLITPEIRRELFGHAAQHPSMQT